jgi:hypothetical protein
MYSRAFSLAGVLAVTLGLAAAARAQVTWLPSSPPVVVADNEEWFRSGEPIAFGSALYYPAGPRVFFDGNRMVRTGAHRGVPIYADTTIEPYSKIFVPLAGGQLQPYERRREGDLAGTTGSTTPSFPVAISAEAAATGAGALGIGAIGAPPTREEPVDLRSRELVTSAPPAGGAVAATPRAVGTTGATSTPINPPLLAQRGMNRRARAFATLEKPKGLNAIYVMYEGARWPSAGPAVRFADDRFRILGEYNGFPVFVDRSEGATPKRIYLPSRPEFLAPYERANESPRGARGPRGN